MPRISSFPDFVLLFLRGSARRCAPKLRRQKTSVRFDSIEVRTSVFSPLLARYRVIMTALWRLRCQSSFAAARSRVARAAPSRSQHARASLLISCLPIFLFLSLHAIQNLMHRWLMPSLYFCVSRLLSISLYKLCKFMIVRLIGKVESVFESFSVIRKLLRKLTTRCLLLIFIQIRYRSAIVC